MPGAPNNINSTTSININENTKYLSPRLFTNMAIATAPISSKVKSPSKLAHVVLQTTQLKEMVSYWETFLGAEVIFNNGHLAFMSYDDEHHRIAIAQAPGVGPRDPRASGLQHIAFTFDNLQDLMLAYRSRKQHGILPSWSVNHGPTTSMYYRDPDGNAIETQVDNFENSEAATAFMSSPFFAQNPIGTDFDPEDLIKRLDSGEDDASIKKRIEIGDRFAPPIF
jgi:catechol-2,3-dioxygenase